MAVIKSGATTDQLTVDPLSKAARVTLYGTSGSAVTALPVTPTPPSDVITTGSISANGASVSVSTQGSSAVVFNVTGTWSGTLQPQYQLADNSWVSGSVFPTLPSGTSVSTISANGQWKTNTGGFQAFRLLSTAWTSGTATVNLEASAGQTFLQVLLKGASGQTLDGTAGTPSTGVVTIQGVGGGTAVPVTLSGNTTVVGAAASGSAVSGNPVLIAGSDGANVRTISTDASGQVKVLVQNTPSVTVTGSVAVTQSTSPWVVSLTSTTITGTVAVTQSTSPWITQDKADMTGTTPGTAPTNTMIVGGIFNTAAPAPTNGQTLPLQMNAVGDLSIEVNSWAGSVLGAPTNFGTTPGAVVAGSVNASVFFGTTAVSSAAPLPSTLSGSVQAISLTAVGQTQTINMLNLVNAAVVITSLGTGGTLATEVSIDNGVTWQVVDVWRESIEQYVNTTPSITVADSYWFEPIGAIWFARVRVVALTSGTITGTMIGTIAPNMNLEYMGINGSTLPNNIVAIGGFDGTNLRALSTDTTGQLKITSVDTSATGALASGTPTLQVALQGQNACGFQIAAGTLAGTLTAQESSDGGTTWNTVQIIDPVRSSYFNQITLTNPNAATAGAIDTSGGATHARLLMTGASGTANATLNASKVTRGSITTTLIDGQKATYRAGFSGVTTVAIPALFQFTGTTGKICRITRIGFSASAATGVGIDLTINRLSAIGTSAATATIGKMDQQDPNSSSVVTRNSAGGTVSALIVAVRYVLPTAPATNTVQEFHFGDTPGSRSLMVRSAAATETIGVGLSATGTTGLCDFWIEWTEE